MHARAQPDPIFGRDSGTDEEHEFAQDPGPTSPRSFADYRPRLPPDTPGYGSDIGGGLVTLVSYALRPLLTLVIVALRFAASLEIVLYIGGEVCTIAK